MVKNILKFLLLVSCSLLMVSSVFAAIAVDGTSTVSARQPSSLTVSHTTSGADRLMLVGVSINNDGNERVTTLTYGGTALTQIGSQNNGNGSRVEIWSLVAPPTGTANVVATFNNRVDERAGMGVVTFTGVDQTTPTSGFTSDSDESSTASITISSALDELAFAALTSIEQSSSSPSPGSGVSGLWSFRRGSPLASAGGTKVGAVSVDMSWTLNNSKKWAIAGLSIKPSAAVSTATLVGNYFFDESAWAGTSGEVVDSTSGENGTAFNGANTVAAGKICRAGSFDGVDDYVEVADLSDLLNGSTSLAFWIKTTQTGNNTSWLAPGVAGREVVGNTDDIFWGWLDATGHIGLGTGDLYGAKSVTSVNDGIWHHIVLTRNASNGAYTVYVDGVQERAGTLASGVIGASYSSLGRVEDSAGTPLYFSGDLDEIYIFDGVIDSAKVNELMNDSRSCLQCVNDDFDRTALGADWAVSNSGGSFGNPRIVNGRLRLTDSSSNVATAASLLRLFPGAGNEIVYEFDHYAYDGTGADGIAIALSDASITPVPGGYGGSLGYAQRCGIDGFTGGWLGVGIDEYGNFRNDGECRGDGGSPTGRVQDSVAVRGSGSGQTGYLLHDESGTLSPPVDNSGSTAAAYGHRYRITVDHTDNLHAYVSVERNAGSGYQAIISTYDASAQSGQAAVPSNWLISMTASTGGSRNIHEIDNLEVCATSMLPYSGIDHYRFYYDGAGITCAPEDIQVKACLDVNCTVEFAGSLNATLSPTGWVDGDSQSFLSGDTLPLWHPVAEVVTLGIAGDSAEAVAVKPPRCFIGTTEQADCSLEFFDSGFVFNVPDLTACQTSSAVSIQAVRTDITTQTCVANSNFANTNTTVNFWSSYSDPVSGSAQVSLSGTDIAMSTPGTGITLNFDGTATANFTVNYPDAGQMQLDAQYVAAVGDPDEGLVLTGNDSFVSRPVGLCVESTDVNADCVSGDGSCSEFIPVDQNFNLAVKAVCWEASGDTDFCSGNATTPNYEQVGIPISHSLVAPTSAGSNAGNISVNSVDIVDADNGEHVISDQAVSEVGVFTFSATPPNYFGTALPVATSTNIGRFTPDHLETIVTSNGSFENACTGFTYIGQPFGYAAGSNPAVTITATDAGGSTMVNYRDDFVKLTNPATQISMPAVTNDASNLGVDLTSLLDLSWAPATSSLVANDDGTLTFTLGNDQFIYTRNANSKVAPVVPNDIQLSVTSITDSDGIAANDLPRTISPTGIELRYGRMVIPNAYGPETLPLNLIFTTEHFNGISFVGNGLDSCTDYTLGNFSVNDGDADDLSAAETVASDTDLINNNLLSGVGIDFQLAAPSSGDSGSVGLLYDLDIAGQAWLKPLDSTGTPQNPTAKATFGIFKGNERLIYMRESVQ